jgi:hypothetical protein
MLTRLRTEVTRGSPLSNSTSEQRRFPPIPGFTVRADFDGGALSSDFGPLRLRGVDRQIGLTHRLAAAFDDRRPPSYVDPPRRDGLAQRLYPVASGGEDGNEANARRGDPVFKRGLERAPLAVRWPILSSRDAAASCPGARATS